LFRREFEKEIGGSTHGVQFGFVEREKFARAFSRELEKLERINLSPAARIHMSPAARLKRLELSLKYLPENLRGTMIERIRRIKN
ncbi:hypothetical protein HY546_02930, partial [archaeon]|nr:hypothetical protein [archaeon]